MIFFHCFSCNKGPQKYSCPRCNLAYCSVACYKSPNHLKCSEEFYKENVLQEMALQSKEKSASTSQNDDVKHMYEILKRIENDESIVDIDDSDGELDSDDENDDAGADDSEGEESDLAKRLEGIDLNNADAIWSNLNEAERLEFKNLVQSEDVTTILPSFKAWWEKKNKIKLVTEITEDGMSEPVANPIEHPSIIESIVDFNRISTKPPASCVVNNLCNALGAYASMVRFFYGEYETSKIEAVTYLMSICGNLRINANYDDLALAIEAIRQDGLNEGYLIDEEDVRQIRRDIDSIVDGPYENKPSNIYILAALSDLHGLLVATKSELKLIKTKPTTSSEEEPTAKEKSTETERFSKRFNDHKMDASCHSLEKAKIVATIKKIEYYLAYANKFH